MSFLDIVKREKKLGTHIHTL